MTGSSRSSSASTSDLGSPDSTPPRTPTSAPLRRARAPAGHVLLRALLPAMVLVLTASSLYRRRLEQQRLADELLEAAARPASRGATSSVLGAAAQLGSAPSPGQQCAEALQIPQVRIRARGTWF